MQKERKREREKLKREWALIEGITKSAVIHARTISFLPSCNPLSSASSRSASLSLFFFLARSVYGPSLRGNFFDKLFSAFFAGGCKLNPS